MRRVLASLLLAAVLAFAAVRFGAGRAMPQADRASARPYAEPSAATIASPMAFVPTAVGSLRSAFRS